VPVASAAPYANHLHFAPDSNQASFFTGRMPFLPPNQQRQSTNGRQTDIKYTAKEKYRPNLTNKNVNTPVDQ